MAYVLQYFDEMEADVHEHPPKKYKSNYQLILSVCGLAGCIIIITDIHTKITFQI